MTTACRASGWCYRQNRQMQRRLFACLMMLIVRPQGEEYIILHKQDQLWWRAQDKHGWVHTSKDPVQGSSCSRLSSLKHWMYQKKTHFDFNPKVPINVRDHS